MDMGEVTRQELDARLESMKLWIEARFAESDAKTQAGFAAADAKMDAQFAETNNRFVETNAKIDTRFLELEARMHKNMRELVMWIAGATLAMAAVVLSAMTLVVHSVELKAAPPAISSNAPAPTAPGK